MRDDLFTYKGYSGSIEPSAEDRCLYGKLQFIPDTILYEAENIDSLETAFRQAVDEYLERCARRGIEPKKLA